MKTFVIPKLRSKASQMRSLMILLKINFSMGLFAAKVATRLNDLSS